VSTKELIVGRLLNDIGSIRRWLKRPGLSSVTVITLAFAIGAVTTIVTVFHVLSPQLSLPTVLIAFADAAREESNTEEAIGSRWNSFIFPAHPYVHNDQTRQHVSVNRSSAARLGKRNKAAESGTPVARARGSRNHRAL